MSHPPTRAGHLVKGGGSSQCSKQLKLAIGTLYHYKDTLLNGHLVRGALVAINETTDAVFLSLESTLPPNASNMVVMTSRNVGKKLRQLELGCSSPQVPPSDVTSSSSSSVLANRSRYIRIYMYIQIPCISIRVVSGYPLEDLVGNAVLSKSVLASETLRYASHPVDVQGLLCEVP